MHDTFTLPPALEPFGDPPSRRSPGQPSIGITASLTARLAESMQRIGATSTTDLHRIESGRLAEAWCATVDGFADPHSNERQGLDRLLLPATGLSAPGLDAALETVLGGVTGPVARQIFERASARTTEPGYVLVILASNLPALSVQPLLAALALRRPVILKSASAEPYFAPAFVRALVERVPELAPALAAVTWPGGDAQIEVPLLARAGRVIAYGESETLNSLRQRTKAPFVGYGPRTSIAILSASDLRPLDRPESSRSSGSETISGLAKDVALFDQRGCLSIGTIFFEGSQSQARRLGEALAGELTRLADRWPPGPAEPAALTAVRLAREEIDLLGGWQADLPIDAGTVLVEPNSISPTFRPSPGLRSVRIQPVDSIDLVPSVLTNWQDRIQGVAWSKTVEDRADTIRSAGTDLRTALEALGVSRFARPGMLQAADADWHNGGLHPLAALGGAPP